MPTVEKPELRITPADSAAHSWRVEVSWDLVVPYWEVNGWYSEVVEVRAGEPAAPGEVVLRWESMPWRVADEKPNGDLYRRIHRRVPSQLAGSGELDVAPDVVAELSLPMKLGEQHVELRVPVSMQRADTMHACVTVVPWTPQRDSRASDTVTGFFGGPR